MAARGARPEVGDDGGWLLYIGLTSDAAAPCAVFVEGQNTAIECRFAAIVPGATEEERQCAKLQSQPYWLHSE
jgi:hypothetical protein